MSSAGVQSWSASPATNISMNGINLAENCAAAGINNALRQSMASVMMEIAFQGDDLSASSSMSLAGVDWRFSAVTGSASIIHVGTGRAGLHREVVWNSPSTLVYSANLMVPGGRNITTQTNDASLFLSFGSGVWGVQHFAASGIPTGYLGSATASATTVDSILIKTNAGNAKLALLSDVAGLAAEVGSFTPTLLFGGGNTGMLGTFIGAYTKIGNIAFIEIGITLTALGSSTGAVTLGGLPFTANGSQALNYSASSMQSLTGTPLAAVIGATATAAVYQWGATGITAITHATFTATTNLSITGVYRIV